MMRRTVLTGAVGAIGAFAFRAHAKPAGVFEQSHHGLVQVHAELREKGDTRAFRAAGRMR
jgi:hypothetical protein